MKRWNGMAQRIGWQKWALNRSIPCVFHSLFFFRSCVSHSYSSSTGSSPAVLCGRQMVLSLLFVWKSYSNGLQLGSTVNSTSGFSHAGCYVIWGRNGSQGPDIRGISNLASHLDLIAVCRAIQKAVIVPEIHLQVMNKCHVA